MRKINVSQEADGRKDVQKYGTRDYVRPESERFWPLAYRDA